MMTSKNKNLKVDTPVPDIDTETRLINSKIIQQELEQFIQDELKILKRTDVDTTDSMIENLADFNLISMSKPTGIETLRALCTPKAQQMTILRLARVELVLTQTIGLRSILRYRYEFYMSIIAYCTDIKTMGHQRTRIRSFIEDHPYCWLFPHIQNVYQIKVLFPKL